MNEEIKMVCLHRFSPSGEINLVWHTVLMSSFNLRNLVGKLIFLYCFSSFIIICMKRSKFACLHRFSPSGEIKFSVAYNFVVPSPPCKLMVITLKELFILKFF